MEKENLQIENESVQEELTSGKNEYVVVRRKKKRNLLNLIIVQVAICLAVSVGVMLVRVLTGGGSVEAGAVNGFFDFVTV